MFVTSPDEICKSKISWESLLILSKILVIQSLTLLPLLKESFINFKFINISLSGIFLYLMSSSKSTLLSGTLPIIVL